MGCCGKKRTEWLQETNPRPPQKSVAESDGRPQQQFVPVIFKYTGERSLKLKGLQTGRVYHFRCPGDTQEVAGLDAFSFMAEHHLKPIKQ
jgi:hypothetical protein